MAGYGVSFRKDIPQVVESFFSAAIFNLALLQDIDAEPLEVQRIGC